MADYPVLIGRVAVWSAPGALTLTGFLVGTGPTNIEHNPQSFSFERTTEVAEMKNGGGHTLALCYHSPKEKCTIKFIPYDPRNPSSPLGSDEVVRSAVTPPKPGLKATIASSIAALNGDWNVGEEFSADLQQNQFMVLTMGLRRDGEKNDGTGRADYLEQAP